MYQIRYLTLLVFVKYKERDFIKLFCFAILFTFSNNYHRNETRKHNKKHCHQKVTPTWRVQQHTVRKRHRYVVSPVAEVNVTCLLSAQEIDERCGALMSTRPRWLLGSAVHICQEHCINVALHVTAVKQSRQTIPICSGSVLN